MDLMPRLQPWCIKNRHIQSLLWSGNKTLKCSFRFIEKALRNFAGNLMFVPSDSHKIIDIAVRIEKGVVEGWNMDQEFDYISSVSFEGHELLADFDENDTFPFYSEWSVDEKELKNIISTGYAVPSACLHLVSNKEMGNEQIYFNRKFRRNFRR